MTPFGWHAKGLVTESEYNDLQLWYFNGHTMSCWFGPLGVDGTGSLYGLTFDYQTASPTRDSVLPIGWLLPRYEPSYRVKPFQLLHIVLVAGYKSIYSVLHLDRHKMQCYTVSVIDFVRIPFGNTGLLICTVGQKPCIAHAVKFVCKCQ